MGYGHGCPACGATNGEWKGSAYWACDRPGCRLNDREIIAKERTGLVVPRAQGPAPGNFDWNPRGVALSRCSATFYAEFVAVSALKPGQNPFPIRKVWLCDGHGKNDSTHGALGHRIDAAGIVTWDVHADVIVASRAYQLGNTKLDGIRLSKSDALIRIYLEKP